MARKKIKAPLEPQRFEAGETVLIIRPSPIWAGYSGEVRKFAAGLHQIWVNARAGKPIKGFWVEIPGSHLEAYL